MLIVPHHLVWSQIYFITLYYFQFHPKRYSVFNSIHVGYTWSSPILMSSPKYIWQVFSYFSPKFSLWFQLKNHLNRYTIAIISIKAFTPPNTIIMGNISHHFGPISRLMSFVLTSSGIDCFCIFFTSPCFSSLIYRPSYIIS